MNRATMRRVKERPTDPAKDTKEEEHLKMVERKVEARILARVLAKEKNVKPRVKSRRRISMVIKLLARVATRSLKEKGNFYQLYKLK